jgi:hypothetical protein
MTAIPSTVACSPAVSTCVRGRRQLCASAGAVRVLVPTVARDVSSAGSASPVRWVSGRSVLVAPLSRDRDLAPTVVFLSSLPFLVVHDCRRPHETLIAFPQMMMPEGNNDKLAIGDVERRTVLPIEARRTSRVDQVLSHRDSFESFCGQTTSPRERFGARVDPFGCAGRRVASRGRSSTHYVRGWFLREESDGFGGSWKRGVTPSQ